MSRGRIIFRPTETHRKGGCIGVDDQPWNESTPIGTVWLCECGRCYELTGIGGFVERITPDGIKTIEPCVNYSWTNVDPSNRIFDT